MNISFAIAILTGYTILDFGFWIVKDLFINFKLTHYIVGIIQNKAINIRLETQIK
ncbi:hypothetical protein [Nostoc sp. NOS(2021)]|uniref:hypothetical protein n=1 Tax=Nostoc sp. NOS(2021) TaxID=2815407 RepID=UPI0025D43912|nr:hypothetical protein [Nostoc sp. NOS(2021)]